MAKSYHSTALPIDAPVITLRSGDSAVLIGRQSTTPAVEVMQTITGDRGMGTRWQIIGALRTAWPR